MTDIPAQALLLIGSLVLIEIVLVVAALWDLTRPGRRVRGDSRALWAIVIILVSTIGPILYFVIGREEAAAEDDATAGPGPATSAPGAMAGWVPPAPEPPAPEPPAREPPAVRPITSGSLADASRDDQAIACHGLTKRYPGPGGGVLALDRLDLAVPRGSVFGLLGPNGAGKTTALRILAGLVHGTSGDASVDGLAVVAGRTDVPRRIGFLDQDPRFYGWLSGRETVDLAARLHGLGEADRVARTGTVLRQLELAGAADRRVATYSGGMRQRLGIAAALVSGPPILILDEPVSSLDPEGRRDLLELIAGLRGTTTVLFSTHVLADVERICDRVAILDRGRLVTEGPLADLLERSSAPIHRIEPDPGQDAAVDRLVARLRGMDGVTDVAVAHGWISVTTSTDEAVAALLPAVVAEGVTLATFERARPTLEDVFLRLVGRAPGDRAA